MGIYSISHTLLLILSIIAVLGFDAASIRFVSDNRNKDKIASVYLKILNLVIPLSIIIGIFLYFSSSFVSDFFNEEVLSSTLKYISFSILPLSLVHINSESLRGMKEIKLYTTLRFILIPLISLLLKNLEYYF